MNEKDIINNFLKPLALKNLSSLKLSDDIYFDKKKKLAFSIDTYVHGIHFISSKPKFFLKKIFRSALSDLFCKGIKPETYFLSLSINKSIVNKSWFKQFKNILNNEQIKFNIFLGGGDTTYSSKFTITIGVLGHTNDKPVLRNGCLLNDDIYVTGNIGDSFLGLSVLKKKKNFGKFNNYFVKKYYQPDLSVKIVPFLKDIATSSIDISDGLPNDLKALFVNSKYGSCINLNILPVSKYCKKLIISKKISLLNIFSKGDDYQILFTSKKKNKSKIIKISKKLNTKITRIGEVVKKKNIIFKHNNKKFKLDAKNMGYTHRF